jgi:predicted house-cleaning NTP pyrophosphatase (Maf/HAM1 superfamily)
LATVLVSGVCIIASDIKCCTRVECADIVQDTLECDLCWCYKECGFACGCCCCYDADHDTDHDADMLYDDSSDSFHRHVYAKKS